MSILNQADDKWLELVSSFGNSKPGVTALRFELGEEMIAVGYQDGMVRVYDLKTDELLDEKNKDTTPSWMISPETKYPITNMKWMFTPGQIKNDLFRQRTLVTSSGDGHI